MPDFTVSTDVDNMLQAGNKSAIRAAIEAADQADPSFTGDVHATGQVDANSVQANNYYGGTGAFTDTSVSGDLTVSGDITLTSSTSSITAPSSVGVGGDLNVSGEISSGQKIDCPQILANIGKIGDVEFTVSDCSIQAGGSDVVKLNNQGITLSDSATSFVKEKCYNKSGAVRLQKSNNDYDEMLLRYEGQTSDDFVIQQWHSGEQEGQIKFLGNTPDGSNTIRLDAKNVDIGKAGTALTKIFSNTNIVSNKKLVFTDTRTEDHGLQFAHSGTSALVQMGMYGSYGQSDLGQFKITHNHTSGDSDVLVVDRNNAYTKLESDRTDMKNAKIAGYAQVGDLPSGVTAVAGMIIYDGTDFKGYTGSGWKTLNNS